MLIQPSNISQYYKNYSSIAKSGDGRSADKATGVERQDRLELSRDASHLSQPTLAATVSHELSAAAAPERLAALKERIAEGSYDISSEKIAASIVDGYTTAKE